MPSLRVSRAPQPARPRRILVLAHADLVPPLAERGPPSGRGRALVGRAPPAWRTERDVLQALSLLGHQVRCLGLRDDLTVLRGALEEFQPDLCFNVLEEFHGHTGYGAAVLNYLELMRVAYSGCNPRGTLLARDKPLAKKLLAFHGIPSPRFRFFPVGQRVRSIGRLRFPLVVKAASEDASLGLSRASVVSTEAKLMSRVGFMHDHFGVDVLVEEYIEGRELNMGVLGNSRTTCLPPFELSFGGWPCGAPRIATERAKWSSAYQERYALRSGPASKLPAHTMVGMRRLALAAYRVLGLSGCARMDFRLAPDGKLFLLEANPNPDLAMDEDFAAAARQAGWDYPRLIQQLVALGLAWRPAWKRVEHGLSARVS